MIRLTKYPVWFVCVLAILSVSGYWSFWASDLYVSEANVVLESPQVSVQAFSVSSLFNGGAGSGRADTLLLRDYLLSVDMLRKIDNAVDFRRHYADKSIDFFSRLYDENEPIEELHKYYLKRVLVELDEYAQVLRISVQGFVPKTAYQITAMLLEEGEAHMNALGQRLAEEQVRFLERQVAELAENFNRARIELINYQNEYGLVSPTGTVESLNAVVADLEAQLANLKAKQRVLISYQSASSPEMVKINSEIEALNQQIDQERARLAQASGGALNTLSSEYQTLELKLQFAKESYSGALAALESTRIEAARKLKQVSILQNPTFPEYPVKPERLYNSVAFAIIVLFLGLIAQMLILIVKDHRD
ncbi:MAG: chain-length determining protein [Chromatiaceae bacterium]|nr:chain-length determining protein [Chromatiaceae bacterium]